MTPRKQAHIIRMAQYLSRAEQRGRTVPAIREGGKFDGRPELKQAVNDADRCRAMQNLQQATYALVAAISNDPDKTRRTDAAIGHIRTAAHDLGYELIHQDDGK